MIELAFASVERLARSLRLVEASTKAGMTMKKRASAWLAGGGWDCLLESERIAV